MFFADVVETLQGARTPFRRDLGIAENLAYPVMRFGWQRLTERFGMSLESLSGPARESFSQSLLRRLSISAEDPAQRMWNVLAKASGVIDAAYLQTVEPLTLSLLERYPALARLWCVHVLNWISNTVKFLKNAREFCTRNLKMSECEGAVYRIRADCSDLHSGNQCVIEVRFGDGSTWFYKPRSGRYESSWFKLLRFVNRTSFPLPFADIQIVSRGDHCWVEAVPYRQSRTKEDIVSYYFRAGALLFLVHWLRGVDFHAGNIVANRNQPIIIDCETLLHPKVKLPFLRAANSESILRTGMVPVGRCAKPSARASALGRPLLGPHSVRCQNTNISASDYVESIVDGFRVMAKCIHGNQRAGDLARTISYLRDIKWRYIRRPTYEYYAILASSLSETALRSSETRRIAMLEASASWVVPITETEISTLKDGDIPIFHSRSKMRRFPMPNVDQDIKVLRHAFGIARSDGRNSH
jgi:lantibiotic modifying enzyme